MTNLLQIHCGDWIEVLKTLPNESVQVCVTSPPYWGLRDYGVAGQIGQESTPEEYVQKLVEGFREVRRGLKNDGTVWLVLGDSFTGGNPSHNPGSPKQRTNRGSNGEQRRKKTGTNLKPKDLIGIPWMAAFALRNDGWYLRSDIVWAKRNCMPESVEDRPTRSHEFIFLLSKQKNYYYDAEAIKEPCIYDVDGTGTAARKARAEGNKLLPTDKVNGIRPGGYKNSASFNRKNRSREKQRGHSRRHDGFNDRWDQTERAEQCTGMRNKRDVWTIAPANYPEAHFATFPPDLIKPCVLAGCPVGGTVLDCFAGSGTTGQVALELGRKAILIEINPKYVELIKQRCNVTPGLQLA